MPPCKLPRCYLRHASTSCSDSWRQWARGGARATDEDHVELFTLHRFVEIFVRVGRFLIY
jgi:hypothetical protein